MNNRTTDCLRLESDEGIPAIIHLFFTDPLKIAVRPSKCPELGVASYGATPEKAQAALEEAVELYLSNAKKLGIIEDVKPALSSESRYTAPLNVAVA